MYRHLVEHSPFSLHVASNAYFADDLLIDTKVKLPIILHSLQRSRFGPWLKKWLIDFANFIWPLQVNNTLEMCVNNFQPDVILVLAETSISLIAARIAKKKNIPLAGLFLDWFPVMKGHYGHRWTIPFLNRNFRNLYKQCDLAICTSDGMKLTLGPHPNSHIIYPIPSSATVTTDQITQRPHKYRLVYCGSAEQFYGRMLCALMKVFLKEDSFELVIIGPTSDWRQSDLVLGRNQGVLKGFIPHDEATVYLASADALLVVMSFEDEHKLFMQTSFTTKFLDYTAYAKPIVLWGPHYCTPSIIAQRENSALVITDPSPFNVLSRVKQLSSDHDEIDRLSSAAASMRSTLFDPIKIQQAFVREISSLCKD
jgi:hypothetical protein